MEKIQKKRGGVLLVSAIKRVFSSKENIILLILLIITILYGAWVRLYALNAISFWGDDGMTYLGTEAVLRYGYPLLPSGYVNFHTILSFYIRALSALVFGLNEFSLRLPSALMGILAIPATFLFVKEVLKNKYIALLSAILISFSVWQIEFSREVRWYSEFQFFYLLSVYFFYLGFIRGKNVFKILSTLFIILSTFINSLAVSLIFLFVALAVYRGIRGFFRRDSMIHFVIVAAAIMGQIIHRTFFWKVGISFYVSNIASDSRILNALGKFFDTPKPFFTTTFMDMFPAMFFVFLFGLLLWFLSIFIRSIRNGDEQYMDLFGKQNWRAKLPFNSFFIYFLFFANTLFLGVGNMYSQQRYINFAFIYFVIGFCWTLSEISRLLTSPVKTKIKKPLYIILAAVLFLASASHINPLVSAKIPFRSEGDAIDPNFAFSNTVSMHPDTKEAGNFIHDNRQDDDLIISMDLLNAYSYTKQFDHWLWSGNLVSWQPYHIEDAVYYDYYFGNPIIRDLTGLYEVINQNKDKNIWIHSNRSKNVEGHIHKDIADFLDTMPGNILFEGKDGENRVYYLSRQERAGKTYSIAADLEPSPEEIIRFSERLYLDFSMDENEQYLHHGWSIIEPQGCWASSRESIIFIQFETQRDYVLSFQSRALLDPDVNQSADVYLNNDLLGSIEYDDMELAPISFYIPLEFVDTQNASSLRFVFKYTRSPSELGISAADGRSLSVFFTTLRIE